MIKKSWIEDTPPNYDVLLNKAGEVYFKHKLASVPDCVSMGAYTYVHGRTRFIGSEASSVGKFCSIANGVTVHCGGAHDSSRLSTYPFSEVLGFQLGYQEVVGGGVTIGNDVWIGESAQILPGVMIGDGAIIGAGAVVTREVAPYSIYVGVPAKFLRARCSEAKRNLLSKIKWWDFPLDFLKTSRLLKLDLSTLSDADFSEEIGQILGQKVCASEASSS